MKEYSSPSTIGYADTYNRRRHQAAHADSNPNDTSTSRPRPRPRLNKVAFVETTTIYEVPALQSFTDTEMAKCWLTPQDHHRIKKDTKRTVKYMRKGYDETTHDGLCTRGLEHLSDKNVFQELIHERDLLTEAVLAEQSAMHETHTSRNIAITSSKLSKRARDRAVQKADLDAAFVKDNVTYSWM